MQKNPRATGPGFLFQVRRFPNSAKPDFRMQAANSRCGRNPGFDVVDNRKDLGGGRRLHHAIVTALPTRPADDAPVAGTDGTGHPILRQWQECRNRLLGTQAAQPRIAAASAFSNRKGPSQGSAGSKRNAPGRISEPRMLPLWGCSINLLRGVSADRIRRFACQLRRGGKNDFCYP